MAAGLKRAVFHLHRTQVYVPRNRRIAEGLASQIGRASSVLDVGCGDGSTAAEVALKVGATQVLGVEVQLRPERCIEVRKFNGRLLPFADRSFDAVTVADVLHHASDPQALLSECIRVCRACVVVKDHFAFGPLSEKLLLWLDKAGNASASVPVRGTYFHPARWTEIVAKAGARMAALDWPFEVHHLPWRWLMPSELQFVARLEPLRGSQP
ncbi:MAG: methyltransferase domain-containing protein [Myxococcales bacterium]|nr:methyltransferase domain-containing protein [Myxococcales bacterium]